MLYKLRPRAKDERGFTLIELLVVILIIGILAAIAIPSFLNQKGKATDASAKELVHTMQVAAESYATDNGGSYASLTPSILNQYESTIQLGSGSNNAYVATTGVPLANANSYTVVATSSNGDTFSILRSSTGTLTRQCTTAPGNTPTGCTALSTGGATASW
jgi:type IV pilus assembly protein PilA